MPQLLPPTSRILPQFVRDWTECRSGSIAIIMSFTILVVCGVIGLCIDGGRAYSVHTQARNVIDAATLAAARTLSLNPNADIDTVFQKFLEASFTDKHAIRVLDKAVAREGNSLVGTMDVEVPTTFMQMLGQDKVAFQVMARADFGFNSIEMVLALDTTGSMAGSKIDALKAAAHSLVDTLSAASPSPDKLRIGLVPFAEYVNVGLTYRNESWIDVPPDTTSTTNSCWQTYPNAVSSNCRMETHTCTRDGTSYPCTYQVCDWNYGEPVETCGPVTTENKWNGCVYSRAYPLNLQDDSYSTRIPGKMNVWCASPLTPLTESMSDIRSAIDDMNASGNTYIPEGVMWGLRLLSSKEPFSQTRAESESNVRRFLVLMTDGANTRSPVDDGHGGSDVTMANNYTKEACVAAKAEGITIFTIAFEVTDSAIKSILSDCASNPGNFFDASNSSQLMASFDAIGRSIQAIRITQ